MNEARIYSLGTEDTWPYLTTDLFALPRMEYTYNDQLIVFGTIFKNFGVTSGWPEWCAKFEALLRTMA